MKEGRKEVKSDIKKVDDKNQPQNVWGTQGNFESSFGTYPSKKFKAHCLA